MQVRENSIDVLRFLGLSLVILAHVAPPHWLLQIRCFDVPLMVFVSGLTCSNKRILNYKSFVMKRFKRLAFPVWIFLSFYLTIIVIAQSVHLIPYFLTNKMVLESFFFLNGIGYVWIIRVFLLVMLATPILIKINLVVKNTWLLFGCIGLLLLLNEIIVLLLSSTQDVNVVVFLLSEHLPYLIGYSALFLAGIRMRNVNYLEQNKLVFCALCLMLFLLTHYLAQKGLPIDISTRYKYPPHAYFLVYGLFMSILLWRFRRYVLNRSNKFCLWVGRNTIWIYLWHIPFVLCCNEFIGNWFLRYVVCYFLAMTFFTLQYVVVSKYLKKYNISKYLLG